MRQPSHATPRPVASSPRPVRPPAPRPRGMQRLSRKTWDKVRTAIRALALEAPVPPRESPAR